MNINLFWHSCNSCLELKVVRQFRKLGRYLMATSWNGSGNKKEKNITNRKQKKEMKDLPKRWQLHKLWYCNGEIHFDNHN